MISKIALASMAFLASQSPAWSDPDRISVLLGSHHVDARTEFEQRNPGLFLTWEDRGGLDLSVGAYRNSYGRTSVAATAAIPIWTVRDAQLSLFAGVALYPEDGRNFAVHWGDLVPVGGVQMRAGDIFTQIIPSDGAATDAIISFGITKPFSF